MNTIFRSVSDLYPKLLGESWPGLDAAIRRLHDSGETVHAVGVFQVRHGNNLPARTLARLARLPAEGEAVDVRLRVTAKDEGEEWLRTFAGRPLLSLQSDRGVGLLVERMGIMEMRLRMEVAGGELHYKTVSAALRLGSLRVPIPRWISPQVMAWEKSIRVDQIQVSVEVTLPLLGRLIYYGGLLTQLEARR